MRDGYEGLLKTLSYEESFAFIQFCRFRKKEVTQYADNPSLVHFGKYECERVPFDDFWLNKATSMGLIKVTVLREGFTQGQKVNCKYTDYLLEITELAVKEYNDFFGFN